MKTYSPLKYLLLKKPKARTFYAVNGGAWLGKFLLFIDPLNSNNRTNGYYEALAVGNGRDTSSDGFELMEVPLDAFDEGIKKQILEKVEIVPIHLYNELINEWKIRKEEMKEKNEFIN